MRPPRPPAGSSTRRSRPWGPLPAAAAHALFVALAMDTGWFRHSNTTPATLSLASQLVAAGARLTAAYDHLFEQNSPGRLRLLGLVLERLRLACDGRVATPRSAAATTKPSAPPPRTARTSSTTPAAWPGRDRPALHEQPHGGVKVSFRSRARIDVARLAEQFGGGGHRLASGAVLPTTLDDARARVWLPWPPPGRPA